MQTKSGWDVQQAWDLCNALLIPLPMTSSFLFLFCFITVSLGAQNLGLLLFSAVIILTLWCHLTANYPCTQTSCHCGLVEYVVHISYQGFGFFFFLFSFSTFDKFSRLCKGQYKQDDTRRVWEQGYFVNITYSKGCEFIAFKFKWTVSLIAFELSYNCIPLQRVAVPLHLQSYAQRVGEASVSHCSSVLSGLLNVPDRTVELISQICQFFKAVVGLISRLIQYEQEYTMHFKALYIQ